MERLNVTTLIVRRVTGADLWTRDYIGGMGQTREVQCVDDLTPSIMEGVDVILFEGLTEPPIDEASVWDVSSIKVVLGFGRVGGRRRRKFVKDGWDIKTRRVNHGEVGGVTTAEVLAWVITRSGLGLESPLLDIQTMKHLSGYSTIVNPVAPGGRRRKLRGSETDEGLVRAKRRCLLDWKDRFEPVECQTVFHKGLVVRPLQSKELAVALDLPNARVKTFEGDLRSLTTKVEVPGKIVQSVARSVIEHLGNEKRPPCFDHEQELSKRRKLNPVEGMVRPDYQSERLTHLDSGPVQDFAPPLGIPEEPKGQGDTTVTAAAAKSDDAKVPTWLWNREILSAYPPMEDRVTERVLRSLDLIRAVARGYWSRKVKRDFDNWYSSAGIVDPTTIEVIANRKKEIWCKVDGASWWNWDLGSTPFFWRWPEDFQRDVLHGGPVRFDSEPVPWFQRAKEPPADQDREKMVEKLSKVLRRGYIVLVSKAELVSLLNVFFVKKGDDDLRAVFDATMSGLNDALWTPWFFLPTPDAITRELLPGYWSTDNDYGEQFLNFPLHPDLMKFAGVDLSKFFPDLTTPSGDEAFGMWLRNLMGLQCSPYLSVMGASRAKRVIIGDRHDTSNPFHWEKVVLNLPGDDNYDPSKPRVMRVRHDGCLATAISKFVDDVRSSASTRKLAWEASTKTGKTLSWLGLQDAPRKRREASQEPGAWAGAMVATTDGKVVKFVSQDRWNKTRERLAWFAYMLYTPDVDQPEGADWSRVRKASPKGQLEFKTAEKYCGFLRYVAMTYPSMVPYLKGIYNTLNIWRPHRDPDGFKALYDPETDTVEASTSLGDPPAPEYVRFARRLRSDINALRRLCSATIPPRLPVRPSSSCVIYMSGDASGSGFGIMIFVPGREVVQFAHGLWSDDTAERSSNYRESANLVIKLREYLEKGYIAYGSEVFIFTDNKVAERTYHKGSGGTKQLHDLVVELRELEMQGSLHVQAIWVAGTRLIRQGTDGLSRGDFSNGVLVGEVSFLEYVPLNKSALVRSQNLRGWLSSHTDNLVLEWKFLEPEDWFDCAFSERFGAYIWTPAPAAASMALEMMCEAKHVRPESSHIFLVPNLMAVEWEKRLRKISDLVIDLEPGPSLWSANQHESLTLAFVCPYLVNRPFSVGRTDWVASRSKEMRSVWKEDTRAAGACMRKFWLDAWRDSEMLRGKLARGVLPTTFLR